VHIGGVATGRFYLALRIRLYDVSQAVETAMIDAVLQLVQLMGETILKVLPWTIALGLIFTVLNHFWACNPGPPWWQKRELATDILYWFLIPTFARFVRIGSLVIGAALIFNVHGEAELVAFYDNGHGPLAQLPLWFQAILFLVLSDIPMYWIHRVFHGRSLWRYHAIHHSSEDLDWISAARFHPVNILLGAVAVDVALLMAGISPKIMIWVGPFKIFHSAFVHANLNWTLGPFQYIIATPVFHRWHHTGLEDGGNTNFATTFPIWDLMFGTFYMPKDRAPANYGAGDPTMPGGFVAQLAHPLRQKTLGPAE
jgi:sterol desaturase/sphingolipid hydroxylase (fatty acid hydroxylase superfamily)